jgi:peptidoglycan hydrolase-like protein with peptidoglycan-binding domain
MKNNLRQEILKELNYLLKEQIITGEKSLGGLNLSTEKQQQIKSSPEEAANYLQSQNTSGYVNVDEAKFAAEALSTINTPELANRFLAQWKKIAGNSSIGLTGSFIGEGNTYQKQISAYGKEIQNLASSGISATPSDSTGQSSAGAGNQPAKISCKRCRGLGKGCADSKDVQELQGLLAKLKFMNQSEQGFGEATEAAVKAFQKSKKLKDDGIVGPRTCIALGLMKPAAKKATSAAPAAATPDYSKIVMEPPAPGPISGYDVPGPYPATLEESKNYYDNKKLNEAKQLFNKLMKNL